jgi:hypothetical protein
MSRQATGASEILDTEAVGYHKFSRRATSPPNAKTARPRRIAPKK